MFIEAESLSRASQRACEVSLITTRSDTSDLHLPPGPQSRSKRCEHLRPRRVQSISLRRPARSSSSVLVESSEALEFE